MNIFHSEIQKKSEFANQIEQNFDCELTKLSPDQRERIFACVQIDIYPHRWCNFEQCVCTTPVRHRCSGSICTAKSSDCRNSHTSIAMEIQRPKFELFPKHHRLAIVALSSGIPIWKRLCHRLAGKDWRRDINFQFKSEKFDDQEIKKKWTNSKKPTKFLF